MGNQADIRQADVLTNGRKPGELSGEAAAFEAGWRRGFRYQLDNRRDLYSLAELDYQLTKAWRNYLRDRGEA